MTPAPFFQKISWSAPEYEWVEKSGDWYFAVGIIASAIAVAAILLNNVLFAIIVILGTFTSFLFAKRAPALLRCEISAEGIRMGETLHRYQDCEAFWIEERHHNTPRLILKKNKAILPLVMISLGDASPLAARTALREHLDEVEITEPFLKKIFEAVGF